jgi:rubredoxin
MEMFHVFDILCAKDFNPNERTGFVFSRNNPRFLLAEQLRHAVTAFYAHNAKRNSTGKKETELKKDKQPKPATTYVYQCGHCLTVYDESLGEQDKQIPAGTLFDSLPADYSCSLCEGPKSDFVKRDKNELGLQAI